MSHEIDLVRLVQVRLSLLGKHSCTSVHGFQIITMSIIHRNYVTYSDANAALRTHSVWCAVRGKAGRIPFNNEIILKCIRGTRKWVFPTTVNNRRRDISTTIGVEPTIRTPLPALSSQWQFRARDLSGKYESLATGEELEMEKGGRERTVQDGMAPVQAHRILQSLLALCTVGIL